jgi:HSP20 family protein
LPSENKKGSKTGKNRELAVRGRDSYPSYMDRMLEDYARTFNRSWPTPFGEGAFGPRWWRAFELPETRRPFADLIDAGKEYRVHVEVPGIPKDKLNISVTSRGAKIEGEAESNVDQEKEGYVQKERTWSKVRREVSFPEEVIPEQADAVIKDGILELKVPKKNPTEVKSHKVQVK